MTNLFLTAAKKIRLMIVFCTFGLASISWGQVPIEGPWLWVFAPVAEGANGGVDALETDQIMSLTQGKMSEKLIAENGVADGDSLGLQVWKAAIIEKIRHPDNIGLIASKIGIGSPQFVTNRIRSLGMDAMALDNFSAYAYAKIFSTSEQSNVTMRIGSDDSVKVWLNGEVVHQNVVNRSSYGFQDTFEVSLKPGANNLLIKVAEFIGDWSITAGIQAEFTLGGHSYRPITEDDSWDWFDPSSLVEMEKFEQAITVYENLIETNTLSKFNSGVELFSLTTLYRQQGLQQEGINFLESIVDQKKRSPNIWPNLIILYKDIKDETGLFRIQQKMAKNLDTNDLESGISYGQVLMETEMFNQAVSVYEELFYNFPNQPYMLWDLQQAYRQVGGIEKAIHGFEKLLESHPDNIELISQIIQLYRETNNQAEITTIRDQLLTDFTPQQLELGMLCGTLLSEDGSHRKAQEIYRLLIESHPNDTFIKRNLVQSYQISDQNEKAKIVLEQILSEISEDTYRNNPDLVDFCADMLIDLKQFPEVQTMIHKLLDIWPEHPRPMELMAKFYDVQGQTDKAHEYRIMSDPGQQLVEQQAPNFQLVDLDENQFSLSQFLGQPVILNFWATW